MSFDSEIRQILEQNQIKDKLNRSDKEMILAEIQQISHIDLSLMAFYSDSMAFESIDIEDWWRLETKAKAVWQASNFDGQYYLYINTFPHGFLLLLTHLEVCQIICSDSFCHDFCLFSFDFKSLLMTLDSGKLVATGIFIDLFNEL